MIRTVSLPRAPTARGRRSERGGVVGRISDEDVARVRDATDLVSLVSETVVLKKKGRLYWGNCPFHGEKTPSFKIDPATQLWHCFGCNRGGDAFGFVMQAENLDFPDAIRRLAERARIDIVEEGGAGLPAGRKERLIAASETAAEFFHQQLTSSRTQAANEAREYLARRGFGSDVAKRWRLGFAPSARDALARRLAEAGFTRDEIVDANLALPDGPGLKDRFFGRIMFPIADLHGRTIAFGGRVVGKGEPKYLNSQETPVFHKSANLYALDRSRNEIVASGTAVVVEGYTDVIALQEGGITNAVATLGTALTERHVKLLGRFGKRVVYLFDGDEAGRRAALRAVEFLDWSITPEAGSGQVALDVALIPGEMDPADYVAAEGAEKTLALIDGAQPLLRFAIDSRLEAHDLSRPEGRSAALADAAALLTPVRESLLGKDYMGYIAGRLQTDFSTVQRAVPTARRQPGASTSVAAKTEAPVKPSSVEQKAEMELVRLAAIAPSVRERARELLREGAVADVGAARLIELIAESGGAVNEGLYSAVARADREAADRLSGWLVDAREVEQVEYAFREVASRVKEFALGRLIFTKNAELRALDPKQDPESYDRLFGEIAELQRERETFKARQTDHMDVETEQT
ncbi:MAG: DNA primase [Actinobacteria bacterium]|nr:DNA primase [Actinomycetota bacterium]